MRFFLVPFIACGLFASRLLAQDGSPVVPPELQPQASKAKTQFDQGDFAGAEKTYREMLGSAPDNLYVLSNLGVCFFREGKRKLAGDAFQKVIALDPNDEFAQCTVGIVQYEAGQYDGAEKALRNAIALNPKDATAHNYLGRSLSEKGHRDDAVQEFEAAVALIPDYADAHFNLAVVLATTKPEDMAGAREHYARALKLGAEHDPALEKLMGVAAPAKGKE